MIRGRSAAIASGQSVPNSARTRGLAGACSRAGAGYAAMARWSRMYG